MKNDQRIKSGGANPKSCLAMVVAAALLLAPSPVRGRDFFLQEGTEVDLRLHTSVDTKISQTGDRIIATVEAPVSIDNVEVIPVGARVLGRVGDVQKPGRFGRPGRLVLTFESIEVPGAGTVPIAGSLVDLYEADDESKDVDVGSEGELKGGGASKVKRIASVAGGAGVGAAAGGGVGAAVGVAVGAGVAFVWFKGKQVVLPAGTGMVMHVDRGVTLSVPDMPRAAGSR